jgi:hypothetical protein
VLPHGDGTDSVAPTVPAQADQSGRLLLSLCFVSGVELHDLRHFYASGLIASGCDVVTVQRARVRRRHHDDEHLQPPLAHCRRPDEKAAEQLFADSWGLVAGSNASTSH